MPSVEEYMRNALRQSLRRQVPTREELFAGAPPSREQARLLHHESDTELVLEISGPNITVSGSQRRRNSQQRIPIQKSHITHDNSLEAVFRYQELIGQRLVQGYTLTHGGAVATRVLDRLDDIRRVMAETNRQAQAQTRRANDEAIRARRTLAEPRTPLQITAYLMSRLREDVLSFEDANSPTRVVLDDEDANDDHPQPAGEAPATPVKKPNNFLNKLGGKRKLLRDESKG